MNAHAIRHTPEQRPRLTHEAFAVHAERFGFEPTDYLRPIDHGDGFLYLVGFNTRARRYPCILRDDAGNLYKDTAEQILFDKECSGLAYP